MQEITVCLIAGQERLKDDYKDPDVQNNAGYQRFSRLHHVVIRAHLAQVISKTIIIQTYGDYPKYAT